jgi:hypothetical protein
MKPFKIIILLLLSLISKFSAGMRRDTLIGQDDLARRPLLRAFLCRDRQP